MRVAQSARPVFLVVLLALATIGCDRQDRFSIPNAQRHVQRLAGDLGVRITGSEANARARDFLIAELGRSGFDVRVQQADAVRPESGQTTRVANIIAVKAGRRPEAVALVTHYDSSPDSRGAADDGLGVAVCLEAGRVLARRPDPEWSLVVALTDAEEFGLMGASALVRDPVMARIKAYLNFEAVGSSAPVMLFQTGPGNAWLTWAWSVSAPYPRGASYTDEIYRRMPNDTDFTILARSGTPGLNFAAIGDGFTYHTLRDVPERLDPRALREAGENAIAIVERLDRLDITRRTADQAVYFSVGGLFAFAWTARPAASWFAVTIGLIAWVGLVVTAWRQVGLLRLLLACWWILAGVGLSLLAMVGIVWALRASGNVVHPWYAHPWRFFLLLGLAAWLAARAWMHLLARLPVRLQGTGLPAVTWTVTLPVWIGLTVALERAAPAASFLGAVPLVVAASALLVGLAGSKRPWALRSASLLAIVASAAVWLEIAVDLLDFSVPVFGRLGIVVPAVVYPLLLSTASAWLIPPLAAACHGLPAPSRAKIGFTFGLGAATLASFLWVAVSPAYTVERPQYRTARFLQDGRRQTVAYDVGGSEPLSDVRHSAVLTSSWRRVEGPSAVDSLVGPIRGAFVYRAWARPARLPLAVTGWWERRGGGLTLEVTTVPSSTLQAVVFVLPHGVSPVQSSLAGVMRQGRWRATVAPPPPGGLTWRARLTGLDPARLREMRVVAVRTGLPDGGGWQGLPPWIRTDHATWFARSQFVVPVLFQPETGRRDFPGGSARVVTTSLR